MKLNKNFKNNIFIIFIILFIFSYHFFIQNGLEKTFFETYFHYETVKRPSNIYNNNELNKGLDCIGMPSGHAEAAALISILLYYYKFISIWICILFIFLFSIQRIISSRHDLYQVIIGIIFGIIYSQIYILNNLSFISFVIVFLIGILLSMSIIHIIDKQVYSPIPKWIDPEMIPSIKKKQDTPYYFKILTLYANAYVQDKNHMDWNSLEKYLDITIERIKNSNIKFDGVVGIKTGGAIISDYISQKMGLPNYKVKISRGEYKCNKQPINTVNDMVERHIFNTYGKYTVCEEIHENLEGKNIILIDEVVASGTTMHETIKYLKDEKHVNIVYPTCISFSRKRFQHYFKLNYIIHKLVFIWPWGYEN